MAQVGERLRTNLESRRGAWRGTWDIFKTSSLSASVRNYFDKFGENNRALIAGVRRR